MVNHAETLLFNVSRSQAALYGLPSGASWAIDPSFSPVDPVPASAAPVVGAIFAGASSPADRAFRTLAAVGASLSGEMRGFFDALDPRRTVLYRGPSTVGGLYAMSAGRQPAFEPEVVRAAVMSGSGLFAPTGEARLDSMIPDLKSVLLRCGEFMPRFSAAVALAAYRLEAARLAAARSLAKSAGDAEDAAVSEADGNA